MRPVTEELVAGQLAVTEPHLLGLRGDVPDGPVLHELAEVEVLTSQVTQRLLSPGQATPAPSVGTPSLHSQIVGLVVIHVPFLRRRGF